MYCQHQGAVLPTLADSAVKDLWFSMDTTIPLLLWMGTWTFNDLSGYPDMDPGVQRQEAKLHSGREYSMGKA